MGFPKGAAVAPGRGGAMDAEASARGDAPEAKPGARPGGDIECSRNLKYTRRGGPNPEAQHLTGREDEFSELGDLTALYDGLATHVRQHVNPLSRALQTPTPAPRWDQVFRDPNLPLQVDVGCGSGRFVLIRARRLSGRPADAAASGGAADRSGGAPAAGASGAAPSAGAGAEAGAGGDAAASSGSARPHGGDAGSTGAAASANVLGLEIREKLVQRANEWAKRLQLDNCSFIFTNATVSWKSMFETYPGPIELVSMQFPDPHFKKKHHKRRHVQPQLVKELVDSLAPGARVFLQGDVPEAVRWMRDMFDRFSGDRLCLAAECTGPAATARDEWESPGGLGSGCRQDSDEGGDEGASADAVERGAGRPEPLGEAGPEEGGPALRWSSDPAAGWLPCNPLGVATEREVYVGKINAPVYRVMLVRR